MAKIELDSVSFLYPGGGGVRDVSLTVRDGEYVALLGPSGSGKTTLLRLVAGFLRPDSGALSIGTAKVAGPKEWVPPERRNLGMVFQQHAVWPHMSVSKNVEYPLKKAKVLKEERTRRVREVLDLVGLADFAGRSPESLSGGQQQRVALARALVGRPSALLLDEPFASLDPTLKERLRVELGSLTAKADTTVVHVTHDREEALGLADRIVVVRDGAVEQVAPPRDLLHSPATPFVASFVSDASLVPVRFSEGRLLEEDGLTELRVEKVSGELPVSGRGVLALRPGDVRLEKGGDATVRAALYNGDGLRVYLDWRGRELRATADPDTALRSGDRVRPVLRRGTLFFGTGAEVPSKAQVGSLPGRLSEE